MCIGGGVPKDEVSVKFGPLHQVDVSREAFPTVRLYSRAAPDTVGKHYVYIIKSLSSPALSPED